MVFLRSFEHSAARSGILVQDGLDRSVRRADHSGSLFASHVERFTTAKTHPCHCRCAAADVAKGCGKPAFAELKAAVTSFRGGSGGPFGSWPRRSCREAAPVRVVNSGDPEFMQRSSLPGRRGAVREDVALVRATTGANDFRSDHTVLVSRMSRPRFGAPGADLRFKSVREGRGNVAANRCPLIKTERWRADVNNGRP